jgi:DNA replication and repair protein RecF
LVGALPAIFIFPEDIELTAGPAAYHRQFLDLYISQSDKNYLDSLLSYQKTLNQRNRLLKQIVRQNSDKSQLEAWNKLLLDDGIKIIATRKHFVDSISKAAGEYYGRFDSESKLTVGYIPKIAPGESDIASGMTKLLETYQPRELRAGLTLVGPHRDRLEININGRPIRHYGSRGQKRCAMISIKLATAEFLSKSGGGDVILILDEAFAELDMAKSRALMETLANRKQVFVATAGLFADAGLKVKRFMVQNGRVSED